MINKKLKKLFAEFEKAIGARDFKKIGELYADTVISAGPNGIITLSRAEFLMKARTASEFYRSVGQTSLKIMSFDEIPISDHYSLVKIRWGATFRKTGDTLIAFDDSYVVQKAGQEPTIIMIIAHQDEQKIMKELGLIE
jgi:hypothetical protein